MAMAQRNAATGRLAQQGALAALQRSSTGGDARTRARLVVAARQQRVLRQRKALEHGARKDHEVGKGNDDNGGV